MSRTSAYLVVLAHLVAFVLLGSVMEPWPWHTASLVMAASAFAVSCFIERRYLDRGGKHVMGGLLGSLGPYYLPMAVALATATTSWLYWRIASDVGGATLSYVLGPIVNLGIIWSTTHDRGTSNRSPGDLKGP